MSISTAFPYARDPERCDLCGERHDALTCVVIAEGTTGEAHGKKWHRVARVAYVCDRHDANGGTLGPPRLTKAPGTSKEHPQRETLF